MVGDASRGHDRIIPRAGGWRWWHLNRCVIFAGMVSGMIYRSIDDGTTWQRTQHQPDTSMIQTIALGGRAGLRGNREWILSLVRWRRHLATVDAFVKGIARPATSTHRVCGGQSTIFCGARMPHNLEKDVSTGTGTPLAGVVVNPARPRPWRFCSTPTRPQRASTICWCLPTVAMSGTVSADYRGTHNPMGRSGSV